MKVRPAIPYFPPLNFMQSAAKRSNVEVAKLLDAARSNNLRDAVDLIKNKGLSVDSVSRVSRIS